MFNPNISCFGKRIRSPFYPALRKRTRKKTRTTDYGFDLGGGEKRSQEKVLETKRTPAIQDYGFDLGGAGRRISQEEKHAPKKNER